MRTYSAKDNVPDVISKQDIKSSLQNDPEPRFYPCDSMDFVVLSDTADIRVYVLSLRLELIKQL